MKILIVMCGCPASGKSTWIKEQVTSASKYLNIQVVSRDLIRFGLLCENGGDYFSQEKQVFRVYCKRISEFLADDTTDIVIADATHINKKSRAKLLNNIVISKDCRLEAVCLETPLQVCLERNAEREGLARVPDEAIYGLYSDYERPTGAEGFEIIRTYDGTYKTFQLNEIKGDRKK